MENNCTQVFIPATPAFHVKREVYVSVIDAIPAGYLTTEEAIYQFIAAHYGEKHVDVPNNLTRTFDEIMHGIQHPYWRIVSVRGLITNWRHGPTMEERKLRLEAEGHTVALSRTGASYQVHDYKNKMFDLNKIVHILPRKQEAQCYSWLHV